MSEVSSTEIFKLVPETPWLKVSNDGRILTLKNRHGKITSEWRICTPYTYKRGYQIVFITRDGKRTGTQVGRLVLIAFVGPCPLGMECCHRDGNPRNNNVNNLRWDTHKSNMEDQVKHGTSPKGERCAQSKLTDEQVIEIRRLSSEGMSRKDIAPMFGIDRTQVSRIVRGYVWSHLPGAMPTDTRFGASYMNIERTCKCGMKIKGPSFFRHQKKCVAVGLFQPARTA